MNGRSYGQVSIRLTGYLAVGLDPCTFCLCCIGGDPQSFNFVLDSYQVATMGTAYCVSEYVKEVFYSLTDKRNVFLLAVSMAESQITL